jgi:hypothetical protein
LIDFLRFPLRETAPGVLARGAEQEIRVRSGRDDNFVLPLRASTRNTEPWGSYHPSTALRYAPFGMTILVCP